MPRIASADFDADAGDVDADAGSIFPASSAVWGEGQVQGPFEKRSAPISMKRGVV